MSAISIVTVVRNDAAGLRRTALSVLSQQARPHEWIIIDGASTDGTSQVAREMETQAGARLLSERDRGLYDAMNKGVGLATGPFVIFLNAGDVFAAATTVGEIDALLSELPPADAPRTVVYGRFFMQLGQAERVGRISDPSYITHGLPTSHQAMLFPRPWLADHPFDLSYRICGDYWLVATAYVNGLRFLRISTWICRFEAGGLSFQHPTRIWRESARIQREVLRLSVVRVARSTAVRVVKYVAYAVLYTLRTRTPFGRTSRSSNDRVIGSPMPPAIEPSRGDDVETPVRPA